MRGAVVKEATAPFNLDKNYSMLTLSKRTAFLLALFLVSMGSLLAQDLTIPIETKTKALVLEVKNDQHLNIVYLGERLNSQKEYSNIGAQRMLNEQGESSNFAAYSTAGTNTMFEPAIACVHSDGDNSLDLRYQKHTIDNSPDGSTTTRITLKDPVYDFFVELFYKAWPDEDVMEQWAVITNREKGKVVLNKFASANLYLFNREFYLTSYNGGWAREMQPAQTRLQQGIFSVNSKLGTRENLLGSQNFMLSLDGPSTEKSGEVLLGQLAWNGNYNLEFEVDAYKNLRLIAGINAYQSAYELKPGESFETPPFIYTLSNEGKGRASRNIQTWLRTHQLLNGSGERLTLLNNWEATYFDFDEQKLVSLFADARELGVNLFLLDDGWFGNKYPRNNDKAGLGDWEVNKAKIPNGIGNLTKQATNSGVKFGIWIEPEMVNPKSELYEKHPDWVIKEPNRPEIYFRNQLVLDLTNPEVQNFVFGVVDKLFTEAPDLAFIKWDCNAPIYNAHSKYLEKAKKPQSHLYVDYVKGLENVLKRIREKYPTVPMMLCSGGGGRTDYNLLKYFTEFWPSDNTDPIDRIFMQWDYSYYYPAITMCNHVTNWSDKPIKFRIDVASMGKLGFDIRVDHLSKEDLAFCKQAIKNYDGFKDLVWHGDVYHLVDPHETNMASLLYVDAKKTEAIMFSYLIDWRYTTTATQRPIKLQGLDTNKYYQVTETNLKEGQTSPVTSKQRYSGEFLMNVGINPNVNNSRTSVVIKVTAVDGK
jgi:alpha-galactosidase